MKLRNLVFFSIIAYMALGASISFAHEDRLNAEGCHDQNSDGTYHCHRGPLAGQIFANRAEANSRLVVPGVSGAQNYRTEPKLDAYWKEKPSPLGSQQTDPPEPGSPPVLPASDPDRPIANIDLPVSPPIEPQTQNIGSEETDATLAEGESGFINADINFRPIEIITPRYPARALERELEGFCEVSFTINEDGEVIEDSIQVVRADPEDIFDRASVRAVTRFQFEPRIKNGLGVEVPDVGYIFRYVLKD